MLNEVYDFSSDDFSGGKGDPPPPPEVMLDAVLFGPALRKSLNRPPQPPEEPWPDPVPAKSDSPGQSSPSGARNARSARTAPATGATPGCAGHGRRCRPSASHPSRCPPPRPSRAWALSPCRRAVSRSLPPAPLPPTRPPMPSAAPVLASQPPPPSDDDFVLPSWAAATIEEPLEEATSRLPEPPAIEETDIQFTVYRPRLMYPVVWYPFLAFAHLESLATEAEEAPPLEQVKRMVADRLGRQTADYRGTTEDGSMALAKGSELTFVPIIPGVEFNPPRVTFRFVETVHMHEFRMRGRARHGRRHGRGHLQVLLGALLIADVPFSIRIDATAEAAGDTSLNRDSTRPFRKIYACYSPMDSGVVEQFRRYAKALGDRWLPGPEPPRDMQAWDDRLQQAIGEADVPVVLVPQRARVRFWWSRAATPCRRVAPTSSAHATGKTPFRCPWQPTRE